MALNPSQSNTRNFGSPNLGTTAQTGTPDPNAPPPPATVADIRNSDQVDHNGDPSDDPNRIPTLLDPFLGRSNPGSQTGQVHDSIRVEWDRIRPFLEAGTATAQDLQFIKDTAGGTRDVAGIGKYLIEQGNNVKIFSGAEGNPQLLDTVMGAMRSGSIPENENFATKRAIDSFNLWQEDFKEIIKTSLTAELEVDLEMAPLFEQMRLDMAKTFGLQFQQLAAQNDVDILKEFGPQLVDLESELRPEDSKLRKTLQDSTQADLDAGVGLTPELQREVEQGVRGAQSARGTIQGDSAITAEAFARGSRGIALQDRARGAASDLLRLNAATQLDPISTLLGRNVARNPGATGTGTLQPFQQDSFGRSDAFTGTANNLFQQDRQNSLNDSATRNARKSNEGPSALESFGLAGAGSLLSGFGGGFGAGAAKSFFG